MVNVTPNDQLTIIHSLTLSSKAVILYAICMTQFYHGFGNVEVSAIRRELKHHGYNFNYPQLIYLRVLLLEHVAKMKEVGALLEDVDYVDLREDYRRHIALELAPKVDKIELLR